MSSHLISSHLISSYMHTLHSFLVCLPVSRAPNRYIIMQSRCMNLGISLHLNHIKLLGAFSCIEHACHYASSRFPALQLSYVARRASGLPAFLAAAPGQKRANETLASYIIIILAPIKISFQRRMTCTNHARLIALKNMTRQLKAFPRRIPPALSNP